MTGTNELEILPPAKPLAPQSLAQLMAHAQAMSTAKQLADALCATDLVPADYKGKPGNGAAAILFGMEIGLNPVQSLQQIIVIHGRPTIYARTAVALVKRAGIVVETVDAGDASVTVCATDPATGVTEHATWDIARATKAGYTKNAKYQSNPQEMLWSKAAMEVCRRIAPHVLLGISYAREEMELETPQPQPARMQARRVTVSELTQPQPERAPAAPDEEPGPQDTPAVNT